MKWLGTTFQMINVYRCAETCDQTLLCVWEVSELDSVQKRVQASTKQWLGLFSDLIKTGNEREQRKTHETAKDEK